MKREMLSDAQGNDVIIEVETVPSGVQRHLFSNQRVPGKLVNSAFSMVSSTSDVDGTDSQIFSSRNDRNAKQWLRFSTSSNESFSQTLHSPESMGTDTPWTSHENIQGSKTPGQSSEDKSKEGFQGVHRVSYF